MHAKENKQNTRLLSFLCMLGLEEWAELPVQFKDAACNAGVNLCDSDSRQQLLGRYFLCV